MRYLFTFLSIFVFASLSVSQLAINTGTLTPLQYVEQFLIGDGIQVSDVKVNNSATYSGNQIGQFSYNGTQIAFGSGILLSSGGVTGAVGPNSAGGNSVTVTSALNGDAQLDSIINYESGGTISINDVAKLEFDFIPVGNTVSFNFIFGSEEYNEFVCGSVNDAFGFFVSGANPDGGYYTNTNLALVPNTVGTTNVPISINTVNNGTPGIGDGTGCSSIDPNWQANSIYFAGTPGNHFQADGMTQMINVKFKVFCDSIYHFKFAISDGGDHIYDSWVFLQDNSFSSPPVDLTVQTEIGSDSVPESCVNAQVYFYRSACGSQDTLVVNYTLSGTATDSVDFDIEDGPIILYPGVLVDTIDIVTYADNEIEGNETIMIGYSFVDANGMLQTSNGILKIYDLFPTNINEQDLDLHCLDDSILLTAIGSGGTGIYQYDWLNSDSDSTHDVVSILQNGTYNYPIKLIDLCYDTIIDTVTVVMNQTLAVDTVFSTPASCIPDGSVTGLAVGVTGIPYYQWNGPGQNNPNGFDANSWKGLVSFDNSTTPPVASGWYYLTVTDNVCEVYDSVFVDVSNVPVAKMEASPLSGCSPLEVVFTNNSENASSFFWDFGDGQTISVNDMNKQTHVFNTSSTVQLIAEPGACADTTEISIGVEDCPFPEVGSANVFSPNNDGLNDLFYLDTKETTNLKLLIVNRWGNKVFEFSGANPAWNGKMQNGVDAEDGVYFYKYTATGLHGENVEGHGFIHLIRK